LIQGYLAPLRKDKVNPGEAGDPGMVNPLDFNLELGPARIQSGRRVCTEGLSNQARTAARSSEAGFAVLSERKIAFRARFQPCKIGDMVCV
jgi:hypothetical protein